MKRTLMESATHYEEKSINRERQKIKCSYKNITDFSADEMKNSRRSY